jgi:hypothetical protein
MENKCRDVVAVGPVDGVVTSAVVHVVQLREGRVAGRFSYECDLALGLSTFSKSKLLLLQYPVRP